MKEISEENLHQYIQACAWEEVEAFLASDVDVNSIKYWGDRPVVEACRVAEDERMCHILWKAGAKPTTPWLKKVWGEFKKSPRKRNPLLRYRSDPIVRAAGEREKLKWAIMYLDYATVEAILADGHDVTMPHLNPAGFPHFPLTAAAPAKDDRMIRMLWRAGANPHTPFMEEVWQEFEKAPDQPNPLLKQRNYREGVYLYELDIAPKAIKVELKDAGYGASDATLSKLGQRTITVLPDDYRAFLASADGGRPLNDGSGKLDERGSASVRRIFSIAESLEEVKARKGRFPRGHHPIADDAFGNTFLLDLKKDPGTIWFWDHELEAGEGEKPSHANMTPIAGSFTEFLSYLGKSASRKKAAARRNKPSATRRTGK